MSPDAFLNLPGTAVVGVVGDAGRFRLGVGHQSAGVGSLRFVAVGCGDNLDTD
jgi:hypothetical protein